MDKSYAGYYAGYRVLNWDTPISTISYGSLLTLVKLVVNPGTILSSSNEPMSRELTIEVKDVPLGRNPEEVDAVIFEFPACIAIRMIGEFYYSGFSEEVDREPLGNTLVVENSPWIAKLKETEYMFDLCAPDNAKHYILLTNEYTIEVISQCEPIVR
ncbi:hypothetical protein [Phormidesmis priestleyi]